MLEKSNIQIIEEINDEFNNKPIGIILWYALGGLSNNVFTSTYTYYIPNKEQLINEVEKVLNENKWLYTFN